MVPDDEPSDSSLPSELKPWQFTVRSLFLLTAIVALLLGIYTAFGEQAFWLVVTVAIPVVASAVWRHLSESGRLLVILMLLQFFGAALLAPGDGGSWQCTMYRLYFALDIVLVARLCLFYRIARKPEPHLSWLTKAAILTSPIYMAVLATYLMTTYGVFR